MNKYFKKDYYRFSSKLSAPSESAKKTHHEWQQYVTIRDKTNQWQVLSSDNADSIWAPFEHLSAHSADSFIIRRLVFSWMGSGCNGHEWAGIICTAHHSVSSKNMALKEALKDNTSSTRCLTEGEGITHFCMLNNFMCLIQINLHY